ncbi:histidine phosphatase family protein [Shewanella frigidimarina]|uniref:histidine phosphatase family protein n=1 Tax=Shewanella frigidimarina TaxID=56812 RepID=UPI003D790668
MKQAKIILMRHGECEGGSIFRGQTDVKLTETGMAQMQQAFAELQFPISHVFSSPLQRCQQFSQPLTQRLTLPLMTIPALQEIDFGVWDGQSFDAIYQQNPAKFDAYWDNPWSAESTPDKAESVIDFAARVETGLMSVVDELWRSCQQQHSCLLSIDEQQGQNVPQTAQAVDCPYALVITHGGVMRCLMGYVLKVGQSSGLFANLAIPYAAIMVLDVYWPDDVDKVDGFQATAMNNNTAKVSFTLHWP